MTGTQELLTEYARGGSERAFRELVSSYVSFVFSTALRLVGGDRPLAEDVTQTVFTDLARKATALPRNVQLGGWLHRHTCFVARKTLRRERRRIAREKYAVEMRSIEDYTEGNLAQLALVLDEAINDLGEADRNAIVLRFFEERNFRSIGEVLGSSEDAARMRVSRAVDKMGRLLKRRGFVLTAAGISFALSGKLATAAPAGLATRIVYVELARPTNAAGLLSVIREACFTRLNIGLVSAAMILAVATLVYSARGSGAKALPDPNGNTITPAEFADLGGEQPDEQPAAQPEVTPSGTDVSPAPGAAPRPVVSASAPMASVKPVVFSVSRAQMPPAPLPTPAPDATEYGVSGEATGNGRPLPRGVPGRPRPGREITPRLLIAPQTPVSMISSNIASDIPVRESPGANRRREGQPVDRMDRIGGTAPPDSRSQAPSANREGIQAGRIGQPQPGRGGSGRSNDPRKRGQQ